MERSRYKNDADFSNQAIEKKSSDIVRFTKDVRQELAEDYKFLIYELRGESIGEMMDRRAGITSIVPNIKNIRSVRAEVAVPTEENRNWYQILPPSLLDRLGIEKITGNVADHTGLLVDHPENPNRQLIVEGNVLLTDTVTMEEQEIETTESFLLDPGTYSTSSRRKREKLDQRIAAIDFEDNEFIIVDLSAKYAKNLFHHPLLVPKQK